MLLWRTWFCHAQLVFAIVYSVTSCELSYPQSITCLLPWIKLAVASFSQVPPPLEGDKWYLKLALESESGDPHGRRWVRITGQTPGKALSNAEFLLHFLKKEGTPLSKSQLLSCLWVQTLAFGRRNFTWGSMGQSPKNTLKRHINKMKRSPINSGSLGH